MFMEGMSGVEGLRFFLCVGDFPWGYNLDSRWESFIHRSALHIWSIVKGSKKGKPGNRRKEIRVKEELWDTGHCVLLTLRVGQP